MQLRLSLPAPRPRHSSWQVSRPPWVGRRTEAGQRQGTEEGEALGLSQDPQVHEGWALDHPVQPHPVPSADALSSMPGSEALMGKVLEPSVSDREGGNGVAVNGAWAPSPCGRVQSLTYPSARGGQPEACSPPASLPQSPSCHQYW